MEGKLYTYHPKWRLALFEFRPQSARSTGHDVKPARNILLFIGGMFDNFLSTSYVPELARLFPLGTSPPPSWTVMHAQLSSAMTNWGVSSLDRDVDQMATAVKFIRDHAVREHTDSSPSLNAEDVNIVLMGHSTGCQDVLHYLYSSPPAGKPPRPPVQGAILQAPASDREAVLNTVAQSSAARKAYDDLLQQIKSIPKPDWGQAMLSMKDTKPLFGPVPLNVSRFMSLASPGSPENPGPDDLFSSDIPDHTLRGTFGKVGESAAFRVARSADGRSPDRPEQHVKPSMLILFSGADEYSPEHIDRAQLLLRWEAAIQHEGKAVLDPDSGMLEGGTHDLSGNGKAEAAARESMKERVLRYLGRVSGETAVAANEMSMRDVGQALSEVEKEDQKRPEGKL